MKINYSVIKYDYKKIISNIKKYLTNEKQLFLEIGNRKDCIDFYRKSGIVHLFKSGEHYWENSEEGREQNSNLCIRIGLIETELQQNGFAWTSWYISDYKLEDNQIKTLKDFI